jgi:hypothetical protein
MNIVLLTIDQLNHKLMKKTKTSTVIMKTIIFTLLVFAFFNFSSAQVVHSAIVRNGFPEDNLLEERNKNYSNLQNAVENSDELKWQNMSLVVDGELKTVLGRYNPIRDAVEKIDNGTIYEVIKRHNLSITFEDTNITYQVKSYFGEDNRIHKSYFIVEDGSEEQGVYRKEIFVKSQPIPNNYMLLQDDYKFDKNSIYYRIDSAHKLVELTTNRRIIKKSYPEHATSIIKYIKVNNLNSKSKKDLIILANHIQNLENKKEESSSI